MCGCPWLIHNFSISVRWIFMSSVCVSMDYSWIWSKCIWRLLIIFHIYIYGVFVNRAWKHIISHETLGFSWVFVHNIDLLSEIWMFWCGVGSHFIMLVGGSWMLGGIRESSKLTRKTTSGDSIICFRFFWIDDISRQELSCIAFSKHFAWTWWNIFCKKSTNLD